MVSMEQVRSFALTLPRAYEALVRDSVKFRVRSLVFVAVSPDETLMGFGFPRDERAALVAADPERFLMPIASDERFNWVRVRLAPLSEPQMRELVLDAWLMVVPKRVAAAHLDALGVN